MGSISSGVLSLGGEHINTNMEIEVKRVKYIDTDFHEMNKKTETRLKDLLIVKDGATTGKVAIVLEDKYVHQNINEHVFLLRFHDEVLPEYILAFLWSDMGKLQIEQAITGATVTGITKDALKNISVILPSLDIQNKIVNSINLVREEAKKLEVEANLILENAKQEIEKMILGETV